MWGVSYGKILDTGGVLCWKEEDSVEAAQTRFGLLSPQPEIKVYL